MTDIPNDPGEGNLGGQSVQPVATVMAKTPLTIDIDPIRRKMKGFFDDMHKMAEGFISDMQAMGAAMGELGEGAPTGAGSGRGSLFGRRGKTGDFNKQFTSQGGPPGARPSPLSTIGTRIGGISWGGLRALAQEAGGPRVLVGGAAALAGGLAVRAADTRIARGTEYASGADKLSVLTQQIYNLSQRQVMDMRRPLTNYRLGAGGINQMLAFQASTGMAATPQLAASIAGLRAATGYSKGTADILQDQRSLLDPAVANRMFFQLGTNAYTVGGRMRDPLQMRQQIIQNMGLNNSLILRGASAPGSVTRARMTQAGIPQEMADDLIQLAKENQTFRQRGGRGTYDPTKPADRKLMGIEGNLATQQQETERLRGSRDEQFMRRQIDNMETAEKQTQTMIKILSSIEDKLSGAIGARAGTAGWQKLVGRALQIGGIAAAPFTEGASLAATAAGTMMVGDPVPGDPASGTAASTGANAKAAQNRADFKGLNPKMQERLLKMFAANPNVGFGGGTRSAAQQESMFRSRYRKTSKKTGTFWQGSYWERVTGAPATPPGQSMHEIGLAADLTGDTSWVTLHAREFGLKNFADVNKEPWHVQPSELPNSRRDYEAAGSPWGGQKGIEAIPAGVSVPDVVGDVGGPMGVSGGGSSGGGGISTHAGMSISEIISAAHSENLGRLGGGGPVGAAHAVAAAAGASSKSTSASPKTASIGPPKAGAMSAVEIAKLAYAAGFRGAALVEIVAIGGRESHYVPSAHRTDNPGGQTGDFGLFQINSGNLSTLKKALGVSSMNDLLDPMTNAKAAYYLSHQGSSFGSWSAGPKGWEAGADPWYKTDPAAAKAAVQAAGYATGDPVPSERSGSSVHYTAGASINFAPTINFYGTPQTPDLTRIAGEVGRQLKEQVRTLELRDA